MGLTTQNTHEVFVGELGPEVDDEILRKAFSAFSSLSVARVMFDAKSGKPLGHGLLTFSDRADAEQAISNMNGEYLGSRGITVRWASQNLPEGHHSSVGQWTYESVLRQAPSDQTTLYIGNLVPHCTQGDLIPLFQGLGYIVSMEIQADQGKASVRLDTHENAAMAILNLNGCHVHGHPMKCDWKPCGTLATPHQRPGFMDILNHCPEDSVGHQRFEAQIDSENENPSVVLSRMAEAEGSHPHHNSESESDSE